MMMQSDWDTLCDCTDELMATGQYGGRSDAMREAQRRNPRLDPTPPGMQSVRPTGTRSVAAGNAEAQLDAAARQIAAARRISFAQAYVEALAPQLYQQYIWRSMRARPEAAMAEFLIPRTVAKFAGAPLTAIASDDLRHILRHSGRDRLLAAAVEYELRCRLARLRKGYRRTRRT